MKDNGKLILILSFFWAATLLLLGGWWLYLLVSLGDQLNQLQASTDGPNLANLAKWEGSTFIIVLTLLSLSLLFLYHKNQKKTQALHDFFASLSHELKTPLASVRLQAEVMSDMVEKKYQDNALNKLAQRLIEDSSNLETQMDKILQLSRLERGGAMNLTEVQLEGFLQKMNKSWARGLKISRQKIDQNSTVLADEFALELIFKNLFENTRNHNPGTSEVQLSVEQRKEDIIISYRDGSVFQGEPQQLGQLFYKYNSSKGSGIGLYLIKKSLEKMNGELDIETGPKLVFHLRIPCPSEDEV